MRPRNRDGEVVDPVPFVVTTGLGFMLLLSFGPIYGLALGASVTGSITVSATLSVVVAAVAYHRYVWTARPELRGHVSGAVRAEGLFYLMVGLAVLVVGLSIPFVAGG